MLYLHVKFSIIHTPLCFHMHSCIQHLYTHVHRFTVVLQCCNLLPPDPLPPSYTLMYTAFVHSCIQRYHGYSHCGDAVLPPTTKYYKANIQWIYMRNMRYIHPQMFIYTLVFGLKVYEHCLYFSYTHYIFVLLLIYLYFDTCNA